MALLFETFFFIMSKISSILVAVVCVCIFVNCTNSKNNSRFSEEQIAQLGLSNVQPLNVQDENSLKIDLKDFLHDKELPVDELIDSIRYIPLQITTKESLIGEVNKLICVDNYVFILDEYTGKNVLIFSDDGTFIKIIPTGQGPQEIFRPYDIAVDEEQGHLLVYSNNGLSFYDFYITKSQVAEFESVAISVFSTFLGIPSGMPRLVETEMYPRCIRSRMHPYRMLETRNHCPTERCIPQGCKTKKVIQLFLFPAENGVLLCKKIAKL